MTWELQSTFAASSILWPAMRNQTPCMAYIIQLALGQFTSSLVVNGRNKLWEAHARDQQFGENESTDTGKSQGVRKEGNARINMMSAMQPALAKIIEKVCILKHYEWPETYIHRAENACCIDYTESWSPKQVHWLSKRQITNRSTTYYGWVNRFEFDIGVAWESLPITRIHHWVA